MKSENKIEGATKFWAWKMRIDLILAWSDVLDIVKGKVSEPSDDERKSKYEKEDIMTRSIIVDSISDNLIPCVTNLDTSKKMYNSLVGLYTINNIRQAMSLKSELHDVNMLISDIIASYFMRIFQLRYQLQTIDEIISNKEHVTTTINGFPYSWDSFASSTCGRKEIPIFEELWTSCTQEDFRLISKGRNQRFEEGNSQAFARRSKKVVGRKKFGFQRRNEGKRPIPRGKKDMSKIQCYRCHKYGHFKRQGHEG